jgi:hypothetical protein
VKCGECDSVLEATWFCIAGRSLSGQIRVTNLHRECFEHLFGRPGLRKMDSVLYTAGWVQERLPLIEAEVRPT